MPVVERLRNVPEADLPEVVEDFESEGATVSTELQPDGRWTVSATFPDDE